MDDSLQYPYDTKKRLDSLTSIYVNILLAESELFKHAGKQAGYYCLLAESDNVKRYLVDLIHQLRGKRDEESGKQMSGHHQHVPEMVEWAVDLCLISIPLEEPVTQDECATYLLRLCIECNMLFKPLVEQGVWGCSESPWRASLQGASSFFIFDEYDEDSESEGSASSDEEYGDGDDNYCNEDGVGEDPLDTRPHDVRPEQGNMEGRNSNTNDGMQNDDILLRHPYGIESTAFEGC